MYRAELYSIGKTKDGRYIVHLLVSHNGFEEEAVFRYDRLIDIPRYLIGIRNGRVIFRRGKKLWVSDKCPWEGDNGELYFAEIHETNPDCGCEAA